MPFLFLSFFLNSCNPCRDTNCLNGGVCNDGQCECPDGYSGENCQTYDPCYNISCLKGGSCINGECNCPAGYTGSDCSIEQTPSKMTITNIIVTEFPATDENGAGWDVNSGADMYVGIVKGNEVVWVSPTYYENVITSNDYDFTPNPYIDLDEANDQYSILVYDYDDLSDDDFMGGITFYPYQSGEGFPSELKLDAGGGVQFTLSVNYSF